MLAFKKFVSGKTFVLASCLSFQFFISSTLVVCSSDALQSKVNADISEKQKNAERIRDELFRCRAANRFYDIIHHKIIKNADLRDMHRVKFALCSTKRTDSSLKSDRIMFIKSIIAVVNWVNKVIMEQRGMLLAINQKLKKNEQLSAKEERYFSMICSFYQTKNIDELLRRVAPVPISLAVAQAALESGFGSSDVIYRNNAFFGIMRDKEMLCSFDTLLESTIAYTKTLNVNGCYKKFRSQRSIMMAQSKKIDGEKLSAYLGWYSSNKQYQKLILQLMKEYDLRSLDETVA